jgi:hypothetical protein
MHIEQDTAYDAKLLARVFELAKQHAQMLLDAANDEPACEPLAWALKGRSGSIREVTDDRNATSNWHPDFVIPLYERSAVGRNERLMPIVRDLLTASDLLSRRWKAQNAEVGKRLFAHAETLAAIAKADDAVATNQRWGD